MIEDILKRLDDLKLSDDDILRFSHVAKVLGVTRGRVHALAIPKNPITPSRIKSRFNELHRAYEVRIGDLREFILNDYAYAKPGRPRIKERDRNDCQ